MGDELMRLCLGLVGAGCGLRVLLKTVKKSKLIDTESVAVFKSAQDIGREMGKRVYAIKYCVQSSDSFELLVTPCKKVPKIGTQKVVYYERANPSSNYYFKSVGKFDKRLLAPCALVLAGSILFILAIVSILM